MLFLFLLQILWLWYPLVLNIYELTSWSKDKHFGFSCKILCKNILILAMHFNEDFREFLVFYAYALFYLGGSQLLLNNHSKKKISFSSNNLKKNFKSTEKLQEWSVNTQPTFCPDSFENQLQTDFSSRYFSNLVL